MGVDPVTTTVGLGIIATCALAAYLEECRRLREQRRRQEEESRRWRRKAKARREEEARRAREIENQLSSEQESEEDSEEERENRLWEIRRRREENELRYRRIALSNNGYRDMSGYNYRTESFRDYYDYSSHDYGYSSQQYYNRLQSENFFGSSSRYSPEHRNCNCNSCNTQQSPTYTRTCDCTRCQSSNFNPFESRKNSVRLTITPPQTTQNNSQNAKNQKSNNQPSSSNSQAATAKTSSSPGNASKQNANSAPTPSSSGSKQPQRNNNGNNNNNNNNNNKKDTVQDYGNLNDFIKILIAVLDRCNASKELREKILSFFKKFEKHENNFLRLLEDFQILSISIEDILSIVVRLFQTDYFAQDVAYENLIALLEIVAKYIKDEQFKEMVEDGLRGNKTPFEKQRAECMKKVLERKNILTEISDLFEKIRVEIVKDNTDQPLEPDFSGIFTKVYHYFKHKVVRGKEWTVAEYFNWIRQLLIPLKGLDPEYVELTDVNHTRRQIVFEVYSSVFQGRFHIVVRAYGPRLRICTFFVKEKYDRKAKDGDKYVDGKKKP